MRGLIGIIQIEHPGADSAKDDYWEHGRGASLASMYGGLLGMRHIFVGYHKLVHEDGRTPEIGFEYAPSNCLPRWPDPRFPQQVHLDIGVSDLDQAENLVLSTGATGLAGFDDHRVYADAVGHPFCLYQGGGGDGDTALGRIETVVFDCPSPSTLASFYQAFLDLGPRVLDSPERVVLAGENDGVMLAFQCSDHEPPRWPDPAHPAQLHLDLAFNDPSVGALAEELGAVRLPVPGRPDHLVYADPAGHPFCLGLDGWGTYGPAQVDEYEAWITEHPGYS